VYYELAPPKHTSPGDFLYAPILGKCFYDMKLNKCKIYIYHEEEADKYPDEICSFLVKYITTDIPNTVKNLVLFSDGPSGQKKSHSGAVFDELM
jgi:hypothetical protein